MQRDGNRHPRRKLPRKLYRLGRRDEIRFQVTPKRSYQQNNLKT